MSLDEKFSLIPENLKLKFNALRKFRAYVLAPIYAWICLLALFILLMPFESALKSIASLLQTPEHSVYLILYIGAFVFSLAFFLRRAKRDKGLKFSLLFINNPELSLRIFKLETTTVFFIFIGNWLILFVMLFFIDYLDVWIVENFLMFSYPIYFLIFIACVWANKIKFSQSVSLAKFKE